MNLKKSFIVSLFILSSFSNANAVQIGDIVEELSSITRPTGIAFQLIEEDGELGDDRELSLTTKQEFCYNALSSTLEGYEAEDYYLKSTDEPNEQNLYLLKFTHWTFNSEAGQDMPFPAISATSAASRVTAATVVDDEESETFEASLGMDRQQGKREYLEKDVMSPSRAVEEKMEHQEDVRSQSLIVRAVQEARMERPKKGLIMFWSITPEVNPSNQEQQDAYAASRAELKKASYVTSIRSFVDTIRQKNEDTIYFSEELSPSMHSIMKAMRLDTIKPNTGFTIGTSFGEERTVHHLQEEILS